MLRRRIPDPVVAAVGATVVRASIAGVALAIVAAPLAAAIGRETANRALVASVTAAAAGGIAYFVVLLALRTPELRSLLTSLRRAPAPLDV